MSSPVEIVIQAVDQFSPTFASLDAALERTQGAGAQAGTALTGVGGSFDRLNAAGTAANEALAGYVSGAEQRLGALDTQRQTALDALSTQHAQALAGLNQRLLAIDQQGADQREAAQQADSAREQADLAARHTALLALESHFQQQLVSLEETTAAARLATFQHLLESLQALAQSHGGAMAHAAQALAVAEALVAAYLAGNQALASVPFPFNLAAAAAVTAQGLATVERIRQVHIAHGGLESVPQDSTYLLQQGERVLSAPQNRALTRFLDQSGSAGNGGSNGVVVQNLTIHVLENATSAQALLTMDPAALRQVVAERLIPMLDELARLGIRPRFVTDNT